MLEQIDTCTYRIRKEKHHGMNVDAIFYIDASMIEAITSDGTIQQVMNTAKLPGMVGASYAMPDAHQGYGFCIGGVAAADEVSGVVSTGGVGFDINCGVRLISTQFAYEDIQDKTKTLVDQVFRDVPVGTGRKQQAPLSDPEMHELLKHGVRWAVKKKCGTKVDLERIESNGCIEDANPDKVSSKAIDRGRTQCGTLGAGNHFIELQIVDKIMDPAKAQAFQLAQGQLVIMIHTGSRGLGHQVCTDYLTVMQQAVKNHKLSIADRQLACAPVTSKEGEDYIGAMSAAANFAFVNRQLLTHQIRSSVNRVMKSKDPMPIIYDIAHNIAKWEMHSIEGVDKRVLVHRKGATRAFPAGHPDVPDIYKAHGHPVLIPGSMGTHSYVLVGTDKALTDSLGSVCHGAGRVFSRTKAKNTETMERLKSFLKQENIYVKGQSKQGLLEESPIAYKDVDQIVEIIQQTGLAQTVVRLKPIGVIKG